MAGSAKLTRRVTCKLADRERFKAPMIAVPVCQQAATAWRIAEVFASR
jgi:hypothetical protein